MKQEDLISNLFGKKEQIDSKPKKNKVKKEVIKVEPVKRVEVGQPYWVIKYENEDTKKLVPSQRIEQGYEICEGKSITKNRHDALYAEVRNYFYTEEACIKAINDLYENRKHNQK